MVEQYLFWILLVGIAVGAAGTWFVIGRLPRRSDDVSPPELAAEAEWISDTIARRGGLAPAALVEEVLELHLDYLTGEPLELEPPAAAQAGRSPTSSADAAPVESASPQAGAPPNR